MATKKRSVVRPGKIEFAVDSYDVHIYPGRMSDPQSNYAGTSLGYIALSGHSPQQPDVVFEIEFIPDGTKLPGSSFNELENIVHMFMNWCQFQSVVTLLSTCPTVGCMYFGNTPDGEWADIEGNYSVPPPAHYCCCCTSEKK